MDELEEDLKNRNFSEYQDKCKILYMDKNMNTVIVIFVYLLYGPGLEEDNTFSL